MAADHQEDADQAIQVSVADLPGLNDLPDLVVRRGSTVQQAVVEFVERHGLEDAGAMEIVERGGERTQESTASFLPPFYSSYSTAFLLVTLCCSSPNPPVLPTLFHLNSPIDSPSSCSPLQMPKQPSTACTAPSTVPTHTSTPSPPSSPTLASATSSLGD